MTGASERSSEGWFERARKVIPGGVNSPVRAFGAVGGTPRFLARGKGSRVWDAEGREYIDMVASWGPLILGHAHAEVEEAVIRALRNGATFGAPTAAEVELAERVVEAVPAVEMVRLVSSGTEATMTAARLARGYTGRSRLIKFEGCYHGHADSYLIKSGSGALTFGVPSSPGVPAPLAELTLVAPYNDLEAVKGLLYRHQKDIAAVIVEPVAGNMGTVLPEPGFLEGLRELTEDYGALLIFDEVITGFRVAFGGAQGRFGVSPDLTTLGKILGGGLPLGAVGGKREILEKLSPAGPVYQAGTLSGNPLATAAGLATLEILKRGGRALYDGLEAKGRRLEEGLQGAIQKAATQKAGLPACVVRMASMMTLFFAPGPVKNLGSLSGVRADLYAKFFHAMLDRGFYFPPAQYEAFFLSAAHTDEEIDRLVQAAGEVLAGMA
ncbi:MAG: glutamate-1-semialdehyde 2,1-aminomutase [Planctomycetes bacterium]|nr:glutamate-1-semialdehyde 2,1-aminomutase [Planctomycetota bacterium]